VATTYEGLIFEPEQGHVYRQTLKLSNKGSFNSSIQGITPSIRTNLNGTFNASGYYLAAAPVGLGDVVSIEMQLTMEASGTWVVLGRAQTTTGRVLRIELRPAKYGSNNPYPFPGAVTMAMPLSAPSATGGPSGDAVATGTIDRNGRVKLSVYLPDGGRSSFSGSILDDDLLAFCALSSSCNNAALIGPVDMDYNTSDRDFGGSVRYYCASGPVGTPSPSGFDQLRTVFGSRYYAPPKGYLPVTGIPSTAYNTLYNLTGGDFGGITKVGTWAPTNKITIPTSPVDKSSATFATKSGLLTYKYTLTDAERLMNKAVATGYAVTIQKSAAISGFYTSSFSNGLFTVTPGDGPIPEITQIWPIKKDLRGPGGVYEVEVRTSGAWEIIVPTDAAKWVQATIIVGGVVDPVVPVDPGDLLGGGNGNGGGDPIDPTKPPAEAVVLKGSGPGTVKVTVFTDSTWQKRETKIEIAGIQHKIKQDHRD
jgi:hypothetical protein